MEVGKIRIADQSDFDRLRELCQNHEGWTQVYNSNMTIVWTRANDVSDFNMIKIRGIYADVKVSTLYDVLHDPVYRKTWDPNILEGQEVCRINANNDVGYYAMKLPKPLANRDFVTQRSWRDDGREKFIVNHSVSHKDFPPRHGIVRGVSYLTGYHVVCTADDVNNNGCEVTYVTQSDPKGRLPSWVVNRATQWLAPKVITRLHKGCVLYEEWKRENRPTFKPWLYPDQSCLPELNHHDIVTMRYSATCSDLLSESEAVEDDMVES